MSLLDVNKFALKYHIRNVENILILGNTSILDFMDLSKKHIDKVNETNGYIKFGESYMNTMFYTKRFDKSKLGHSKHSLDLKAYNIDEKKLQNHYGLVLLFGPDSGGRDIMILQILKKLKVGSFIMVNKEEKYNIENLKKIFKLQEMFHNFLPEGRIYLYKIMGFIH